MPALKGGWRAIKGLGTSMQKGWGGKGMSGGSQGLVGAGTAAKNYVKRMANSQAGSKNLMTGTAMAAVPTLGAASLLNRN